MVEPTKGALHNPTTRLNFKALLVVGSQHDLDVNTKLRSPLYKLASIGGICPDFLEAGINLGQQINQPARHCAIVIACFRDKGLEDQAFCVDNQVAFAPFDLFPCIVSATTPFSVVLTDGLSIIAALGVASRPSSWRKSSRNAWFIRCQIPSLRQVL